MSNKKSSFKGRSGTIEIGDYIFVFGKGSLKDNTEVTIEEGQANKDLITQELKDAGLFPGEVVTKGLGYNVQINNENIIKPVKIILKYNDELHGNIDDFQRLSIAQERDGEPYLLRTWYDDSNKQLYAYTDHFSLTAGALAMGIVVSGFALAISLLTGYTCQKLQTDKKYVNHLPNDIDDETFKKFKIDPVDLTLKIQGKKLVGVKPGKIVRPPKMPKKWLKEDTLKGYCIDWAYLYASLLLRSGYPVRMISGDYASIPGDQKSYEGHQWVEVLYNNKVYVVDTLFPDIEVRLIPREKAYKDHCVNIKRIGCFIRGDIFETEGDPIAQVSKVNNSDYVSNWWEEYKNSDEDDVSKTFWECMDRADKNLDIYKNQYYQDCLRLDELKKIKKPGKALAIRTWEMEDELELREFQLREAEYLIGRFKQDYDDTEFTPFGYAPSKYHTVQSVLRAISASYLNFLNNPDTPDDHRIKALTSIDFWKKLYFVTP